MLDLGTSFLASVARDPDAPALIDGDVRLSYRNWYGRISALASSFDAVGLHPGDHLVTVLQNNWQAATIHWACQFAGIIITPLNWRSSSDELDFCLADAELARARSGMSLHAGQVGYQTDFNRRIKTSFRSSFRQHFGSWLAGALVTGGFISMLPARERHYG